MRSAPRWRIRWWSTDNRILNPEGMRFPDEFVRHKVLDAIGDLALAGAPLLGAYRSVRGGHKLNHAVLSALMSDASAWTWSSRAGPSGPRPCRSGSRAGRPRPTRRTFPNPGLYRRAALPSPHSGRIVRIFAWSGRGLSDMRRSRCGAPVVDSRGDGIHPIHGVVCSRRTQPIDAARRIARVVALALAAAPLGGCDTLSGWFGKDEPMLDEPADKLYNEGLYLLNEKKRPTRTAAKRFEEVDRQHPYSDWARKSLIMSAYAYYEAGKYEESINAARRYIQLHPGSPDAAYAQFLIGSCYFDQIRDVTRDQDRTEKAMQALDEVVRKYPNTEYAVSAKRKIDIARDQLAGKEMMVGRYYMERRDFTGAINRFKIVVTRYQTTRHVEEALLRLTEAYHVARHRRARRRPRPPCSATISRTAAGTRTPTRWCSERGLEPSENRGSWISQAFRKFKLG